MTNEEIFTMKGQVTRASGFEKDGKKKYGIQLNNNEETWFNGFGSLPAVSGDIIEFEYTQIPKANHPDQYWFNIKKVLGVESVHEEPSQEEIKTAQQIEKVRPTLTQSGNNENDKQNRRTLMMKAAVDICKGRQTFTGDEIISQFIRLMNAIEEPLPEALNQLNAKQEVSND